MALLHTTSTYNLTKILKEGSITPKYPDEEHISAKGVYTVYVFKTMNYDGKYWYYGSNIQAPTQVIISISPKALKDLKFMVCPGINYGNCIHHPEDIIMTETNFNKKRLETTINKELDDVIKSKAKVGAFDMLTHEVVFLEPVPIKYIDAIIVAPIILKKKDTLAILQGYIDKLKEQKLVSPELKIIKRPKDNWKDVLFGS